MELFAAADPGPGPYRTSAALVVLGVRADFEHRCADYPQLAGAVQDRYLVVAMTERQLRLAVTEPAKAAGSRVDDDLVEVLLADVRARQPGVAGAGVLPLLSLTPSQQAAARQVFTRLTAARSDGMDTADRAARAELTEGRTPAETGDVEVFLEAFAAERLLTLAADSLEISHEVAADRVAAAARHLAQRNPRRPDHSHPDTQRRSRMDTALPRSVLSLPRKPAASGLRNGAPDRRIHCRNPGQFTVATIS